MTLPADPAIKLGFEAETMDEATKKVAPVWGGLFYTWN